MATLRECKTEQQQQQQQHQQWCGDGDSEPWQRQHSTAQSFMLTSRTCKTEQPQQPQPQQQQQDWRQT
jgi:hypothetical protein